MTFDLVTGGAGFVGSELVRQLVDAGRRVRVLDNLSTGRIENLEGVDVDLVNGDVLDETLVTRCLRDVGTVYHLACVNLRRSLHSPLDAHIVNAEGTLALLQIVRSAGISRFVHVSSADVYGSARYTPMDEAHPTEPTTDYGASKLAGEAYARAHHLTHGLRAVIVRPFNAIGGDAHHEGDSGEVLPKFVLRALAGRELLINGSGSQTRDFTHVRDIAAGIHATGTVPEAVGRTFNLGTGHETSINDLADLVISLVASYGTTVTHVSSRPGDVGRLCADATAARDGLGFTTTRSLRDGILELAARFRDDPRGLDELLGEEEAASEPVAAG